MTTLLPTKALFSKEPRGDSAIFTKQCVFTPSAREAWLAFLLAYSRQCSARVLLPAYIGYTEREGSGVFDPVSRAGVGFGFYPVNDFLHTSVADLEPLLESREYGVLLVVHWFGLPHVDMQSIQVLCRRYEVLLVEDCAHVMAPPHISKTDLGGWGDAAFYSAHKMYGGDVGGMLTLHSESRMGAEISDSAACSQEVLESMLSTDVAGVMSHRRRLYQIYAEAFSHRAGIKTLFPEIGPHTPQTFAVLVQDGLREQLYFALMDRGIPLTALYYRLISQIDETRFPESFRVANSILNFPVHQDVSENQVLEIISSTIDVLQRLRP